MNKVQLRDVAEIISGGRHKLSGKQFVKAGGFPAYGAGGLNGYLDHVEFRKSAVVLSSIGARCGKCFLTEPEWTSLANTQVIFPNLQKVDLKFLWYQLDDEGRWPRSGAAQPFIKPSDVKAHPILLPPLEEQQRIVAVLDKAFSGIAATTANAQKNLTDARALFESELDAEILQIQAQFNERFLGEFCERITVGHVGPMKTRYFSSGIPFLRSQNVRPFKLALDNVLYIDDAFDAELKKSRLQAGDVAVVRTGYPGTAAVIPESLKVANCADLVIIRPAPSLNPHYLAAILNSNTGKISIAGNLNGAAQKHFNVGAAKKMKVAIPPLIEQERIVDRIELINQKSQALSSVYQNKLAALSELKQSLLHKAFAGGLT